MFILVAQEWIGGLRRGHMALTMKSNATKREKGSVIENSHLSWKICGQTNVLKYKARKEGKNSQISTIAKLLKE